MTDQSQTTAPQSLLSILGELSALLQGATGLTEKQAAFFKVFVDRLGFDLVWLGTTDLRGACVQGQGGVVPTGTDHLLTACLPIVPGEFIDRAIEQREIFITADFSEDPLAADWWPHARAWGIRGAACFPLTFQGNCLGVCLIGSCRRGMPIASQEEQALRVIGDLVGAAIHQERTLQETVRQDLLATPLLALADRLRQPQQMDPVFQTVVEELHACLAPTRVVIYWLDRDRREFWVRTLTENTPGGPTLGARLSLRDFYPLYQELNKDRTVLIADLSTDGRSLIGQAYARQFGLQALLAHPILCQNELLGYLALEETEAPRDWHPEEYQLVRAMAHLLGVSTIQSRLYELTRRQALEQTLINQITRDIRNTLDPDQVLQSAVERLGTSLAVDRCLVLNFALDRELQVLHEYSRSGLDGSTGPAPSLSFEVDRCVLGSTIPLAVDDIETDFYFLSWKDYLRAASVRSMMVCGTAYQGQPNGVLVLQHCHQTHHWTAEEQSVVQAVADQVGIALGQAQLYRRTQEQAEIELRINQISRSIRTAIPAGQVAESSLKELSQVLESPLAALLFCSPTDAIASLRCAYSRVDGLELAADTVLPVAGEPFLQAVFEATEPVELLLDPVATAGLPRLLGDQGIRSLLGMRLQAGNRMLGIVLAMSDQLAPWPAGSHQILTRLSGEFALAFSQAEAFEKLQELSQELSQLNEYKNNMVAISSHEMRTPLASIRAYVETMISEPELDTATIQEFMRGTELECIRLTNLLDDLNTLVALEARRTEWEYRLIAVRELVEVTVARMRPLIEKSEVTLRVESRLPTDFTLHVDAQKVEQVLMQLLENACKHTQPGCQIVFSVAPSGETGDWLEFTVRDDGPGIPAHKLKGLFQPFVRVQEVMNHSRGGAGLGLAICKAIVDQMGGQIEVESEVNQGSLFKVTLPVQPVGPLPSVVPPIPGD